MSMESAASRRLLLALILASPTPAAATIYGYSFGYAPREQGGDICTVNENTIQVPLFQSYNRGSQQWWYNLVEEAEFSNVPYLAMNFRGDSPCGVVPPPGGEPTSFASNAVTALINRNYDENLHLALFDDTAAVPAHYEVCTGNSTYNLGNSSLWAPYWWDYRWRRFFQNVPDANRMKVYGRPLIFMWSVAPGLGFTNHSGNLRALILWLRQRCQAEFGFDPFIIVDYTWLQYDSSVGSVVDGVNKWFLVNGGNPWSKYTHNGYSGSFTTGIVNPGFWIPSPPMFTPRNNGNTLRNGLNSTLGSHLVLMEGITDIEENAGFFRSEQCEPECGSPYTPPAGQCWSHPNQYINIVREYSAPDARFVVYEAEACDTYNVSHPPAENTFRRGGQLETFYATLTAKKQWLVGLMAGEWVEFQDFELGGSSIYKVTIRYSSVPGATVQLKVDGQVKATVSLGPTGGWRQYQVITGPSQFTINSGYHDVRLLVTGGHARIDYWLLNGLF